MVSAAQEGIAIENEASATEALSALSVNLRDIGKSLPD